MSAELSSLFNGPNGVWNLAPQLTQPIFTAGRIKANVKLAEAGRTRALVQYERTIETAFAEVSNSLSSRTSFWARCLKSVGGQRRATAGGRSSWSTETVKLRSWASRKKTWIV